MNGLGFMSPTVRSVCLRLLSATRKELGKDMLGAGVFGSTARKNARVSSDLDLLIVTALDWEQRRRGSLDAVEFDVTLLPLRRIEDVLAMNENSPIMHIVSTTQWILTDSQELQRLADAAQMRRGLPRSGNVRTNLAVFAEAQGLYYRLLSSNSVVYRRYLNALLVELCLRGVYDSGRFWIVPTTEALLSVQIDDPVVHDLCIRVLGDESGTLSDVKDLIEASFGKPVDSCYELIGPKMYDVVYSD